MSDKDKKQTIFKTWCIANGIQQKHLRDLTNLSEGLIHFTWCDAKASKSAITLLSYALGIDEKSMEKMILTFDIDQAETKRVLNGIKKRK